MSAKLYLGLRNPSGSRKIQIDGIDMESQVNTLKQTAAETAELSSEEIELVFCGIILKDGLTLTAAGLRPGVTVYVLKKKAAEPPKKTNNFSESDISHLVSAFKNATKNPNYRTALLRLSRPEVLEHIMVATPGLRDDPVALAMIHDVELLTQLCDVKTVRRVMEAHPALAEAANYIVAVIHEEAAAPASTSAAPTSGYFYSLEALSDEEDMESSQASGSSDSQQQAGESSFNPTITSIQLAAALAAAQSQASSAATTQPSDSSAPGGLITPEMLGQALGQAFASTGSSQPAVATPVTPTAGRPALSDLEATSRRLAQHLHQMRELGLRDDTLNLQALQATEWNVQEAINLVFSGAMADLDTDMD